jgi:predicted CoA-binding protein
MNDQAMLIEAKVLAKYKIFAVVGVSENKEKLRRESDFYAA